MDQKKLQKKIGKKIERTSIFEVLDSRALIFTKGEQAKMRKEIIRFMKKNPIGDRESKQIRNMY